MPSTGKRWYEVNGEPVEQLFEFIEYQGVTGDSACDSILNYVNKIGLDVILNYCRSNTTGGKDNMGRKQLGVTARLKLHYSLKLAVHVYIIT